MQGAEETQKTAIAFVHEEEGYGNPLRRFWWKHCKRQKLRSQWRAKETEVVVRLDACASRPPRKLHFAAQAKITDIRSVKSHILRLLLLPCLLYKHDFLEHILYI